MIELREYVSQQWHPWWPFTINLTNWAGMLFESTNIAVYISTHFVWITWIPKSVISLICDQKNVEVFMCLWNFYKSSFKWNRAALLECAWIWLIRMFWNRKYVIWEYKREQQIDKKFFRPISKQSQAVWTRSSLL